MATAMVACMTGCGGNNTESASAEKTEAVRAFCNDPAFVTGDDSVLEGGIGDNICCGVSGPWVSASIKEKLGDNFGAAKLPTFTCNGEQVQMGSFLGCINSIRVKNMDIPKDIAIMTFDNYPFSMLVQPMLTAIEVDMFEMGSQAARFMLQKIKRPNMQTQSFCSTPILIEREST